MRVAKEVRPTGCPVELRTKSCCLVISIIIRHELGFDRPVSVSSKGGYTLATLPRNVASE